MIKMTRSQSLVCLILTLSFAFCGWRLGLTGPPSGRANPTPRNAAAPLPLTLEPLPNGHDPISLLAVPAAEYPERIRKAIRQGWREEKIWFARHWAALDPPAVYAFAQAMNDIRAGLDSDLLEACFASWLLKDRPSAKAVLEKLEPGDYSSCSVGLRELMKIDPRAVADFLLKHPDSQCAGSLSISNVPAFALSVSEEAIARRQSRQSQWIAAGLSDFARDRAEKLAWLKELPLEVRAGEVPAFNYHGAAGFRKEFRDVHSKAFSDDEIALLEKTVTRGMRQKNGGAISLLKALRDPEDALRWTDAHLSGQPWLNARRSLLYFLAPKKFNEVPAYLKMFPRSPLRQWALSEALQELREIHGPRAVCDWLPMLSNTSDVKYGLESVAAGWATASWSECAAWLNSLAPDPWRIQSAAAAVGASVENNSGEMENPWSRWRRHAAPPRLEWESKLQRAASLPQDLALAALGSLWSKRFMEDSRILAESAATQPSGAIRELAMRKASEFSRFSYPNSRFNHDWLAWAGALPEAADRSSALRGALETEDGTLWTAGVRDAAKARLNGSP